MEQSTLKNININLSTNIYSYLETSGGQSSDLYLKVAHFLTPVLDICGSLRLLFSCIGVYYALFHWIMILNKSSNAYRLML